MAKREIEDNVVEKKQVKKNTKKDNKKIKTGLVLIVLLVLFIAVGGVVFLVGKKDKKEVANKPDQNQQVEEKKLQIIDQDSTSRPIAVMINNHYKARPYHSGLQDAYLVYEIIVEGGITRYLAVFKDQTTERIGSVRSARHDYLDYVWENDAIYVHWGWSPQAQSQISQYKVNNLNGLTYEGVYFYRDNSLNVDYEHRGFTSMELINKGIKKRGYSVESNKDVLLNYSVDEVKMDKLDGSISAGEVVIQYSNSITTSYKYDAENKVYLRYINNNKHCDYVTKEQYTAKNIITYKVANSTIKGDVKGRQELDNIGSGTGYYISNGYAVPIKWEKKDRKSQTIYTYEDGTEIDVNDGNTYIQIQPISKELTISGVDEQKES